jgi:hypothetical protein
MATHHERMLADGWKANRPVGSATMRYVRDGHGGTLAVCRRYPSGWQYDAPWCGHTMVGPFRTRLAAARAAVLESERRDR